MHPIITATNLVKQYPGVRAVDGINLSIPQGICFGLRHGGNRGEIEAVKDLTKSWASSQDRDPGESGLKAFEAELLK